MALIKPSLEIAQQVKEQDVQVDEEGCTSLIKGVAKDRLISVEDGQMRHGRKSRSVRVDGYSGMYSTRQQTCWLVRFGEK